MAVSPPQTAPPPGTACRSPPPSRTERRKTERHHCIRKALAGQPAAGVGSAEERRARGRARQRASSTDLPQLFERSGRRPRSEFCGRPRARVPQGSRPPADRCRRPLRAARPALCRATLRGSEFAAEGAVLEGAEESVEFCAVLLLQNLLLSDSGTTYSELLLKIRRRRDELDSLKT